MTQIPSHLGFSSSVPLVASGPAPHAKECEAPAVAGEMYVGTLPGGGGRTSALPVGPPVTVSPAATCEAPLVATALPASLPFATPLASPVPATLVEDALPPPALTRTTTGYDRSFLDPTVRPQDDFYQYALGGYLKSHPIPPDKQSYGIRTELNERVEKLLHEILEASAHAQGAPGSVEQKLGDFYASGMDEEAINAAGARPLAPLFERIGQVETREQVQDAIGWLHAQGLGNTFSFGGSTDVKNPDRVIGRADQGGLGLPDKSYYLDPAADKQEIRHAYVDHVARTFELLGEAPEEARRDAEAVLSLETSLASASLSRAERRDPTRLYHIMDRAQLAELTPHLSWDRYFGSQGRPDLGSINVATPDFFKALDQQVATRPVEDWKAYLRWHVINQTASYLSRPFEDENFAFKGGVLSGIQEQGERWKKISGLADDFLGEALGQKFVEKTFPPEARERARAMVDDISSVMRDRIQGLSWMGDETKKEALAKIDRLHVKIGYPDTWETYAGLEVDRGSLIGNVLRAKSFFRADSLAEIGQPVDRAQWGMTPATVNAYYSPTLNEIVFPAARLLPPFFDPDADDAMNYGATGCTIAHELTHGFDDSGAKFDSSGMMRDWWTPEDRTRFTRIADGVVSQMGEFEYDGQKVDGRLVAGEAMADLGGIEIAYEALQRALARRASPATEDGFTPQQRFFLGYALCRESAETPKAAHLQMSTDPHPLGRFRVNGPLANMPTFHRAFGCREGDAMVRPAEKRNSLWNS